MKIPFDIKYRTQIESGEYKVETEAGFPVKVMDWEYNDRIGGKGIAIKIIESDGDHAMLYTYEGKRSSIFQVKEGSDLFIITPEPELSEFEKGYMRIVHKMKPEDFNDEGLKIAKEEAAELLVLARKEIMDGWRNGLRDTQDQSGKAYSDGYELGLEKGKAEALKDLPRWIKSGCVTKVLYAIIKTWHGEYRIGAAVEPGDRFIPLCMLEKLPGFNE